MSSTKEILKHTVKGGIFGCLGSALLFLIGLATDKFSRESEFLDPHKASLWIALIVPLVFGLLTGSVLGMLKRETNSEDYETLVSSETTIPNIQGQAASGPVITSDTLVDSSAAGMGTANQFISRDAAGQLPHSPSSEYLAHPHMPGG